MHRRGLVTRFWNKIYFKPVLARIAQKLFFLKNNIVLPEGNTILSNPTIILDMTQIE